MADFKPNDLLVGIVDFFAVLLPGAVLAFALQLAKVGFIERQLLGRSQEEKWIIFVVASYLLGHFVSLIGAAFLDDLYDKTYARRRYTGDGSRLLNYVGRIKRRALSGNEIENNFKWARAFIRLNKSDVAADIDRLEADSKFFRSLAVVAALGWVLAGIDVWKAKQRSWLALLDSGSLVLLWLTLNYQPKETTKKKTKNESSLVTEIYRRLSAWILSKISLMAIKVFVVVYVFIVAVGLLQGAIRHGWNWWLVIGCFSLMCLSAWRYADQRWKTTQAAYLYFAVMNQPTKAQPEYRNTSVATHAEEKTEICQQKQLHRQNLPKPENRPSRRKPPRRNQRKRNS